MTRSFPPDPALLARLRAAGDATEDREEFARQIALAVVTGGLDADAAALARDLWGERRDLAAALTQFDGLPRFVGLCWTVQEDVRELSTLTYPPHPLYSTPATAPARAVDIAEATRPRWGHVVKLLNPGTPVTYMGLRLLASGIDESLKRDLAEACALCQDLLTVSMRVHGEYRGWTESPSAERYSRAVRSHDRLRETLPVAQREFAVQIGRASR